MWKKFQMENIFYRISNDILNTPIILSLLARSNSMISIFTNISSISTVSFPFPPGVTRCRKRLMDTERSPWTEISIRTGWIWVIRRGPVRSMYTVSRAYNNGRSRVEELLTSASKDSSSFVLPLWSMSRTMGTMTCILINSVTTRLQDTAVRFLRL